MKRFLIITILFLIVSLPLLTRSAAQAEIPARLALRCTDKSFYLEVADDVQSIGDWLTKFQSTAEDLDAMRLAAANGLVEAIGLRHKYEGMKNLSDGCKTLKALLVIALQNLTDFMSYTLAALDVPDRREEYVALASRQGALLNASLDDVVTAIKEQITQATQTTIAATRIPPTKLQQVRATQVIAATRVPVT